MLAGESLDSVGVTPVIEEMRMDQARVLSVTRSAALSRSMLKSAPMSLKTGMLPPEGSVTLSTTKESW